MESRHLILHSDVPSSAELTRQESWVGTTDGQLPLHKHMPLLRELLQQKQPLTTVQAATGSGKSMLIPTEMSKHISQKLLVLNPSTLDTENVCNLAQCPACFCMGKERHGGVEYPEAKIVFVTVDLATKWYTSHGVLAFQDFDGVYCDEMHDMEINPQYSMLWEVFHIIARDREFIIVGASATFSDAMKKKLDMKKTRWVRCQERPQPLERNIVTVFNVKQLYEAMAHMTAAIIEREESCLLFLPGKLEIRDMQQTLTEKKGIEGTWISQLHADVGQNQIADALNITSHPKVILATSIAETSITLPQIDHVLDAGFCRIFQAYDGIVSSELYDAPPSVQSQRQGRAGRVQRGSATRFLASDRSPIPLRPLVSSESCESVVVLEKYHLHIKAQNMDMCVISAERSASTRQRIKALSLSDDQLWQALTALPFSLTDAAIFFKSMQDNVSYEVAAVLIFKNTCIWPGKMRFSLSDIVTAVSQPNKDLTHPDTKEEVGILHKARIRFTELCVTFQKAGRPLTRSPWNASDTDEAVAVAFLASPERLLWHRGDQDPACFLGEKLVDCKEEDYSVGVLFKKSRKGLQCSLHLPFTEWVSHRAHIQKFTRTAKLLSDSTVFEFRVACIVKLRSLGYDMRLWHCQGGKQETEFAVDIILSESVDLCIIFPNGNRLARQQHYRQTSCVGRCADEMATALHATARMAVAFVSGAILPPSVRYAAVFQQLGLIFLILNIASNKTEGGRTRAHKWNIHTPPLMHLETWCTENICEDIDPNVVITNAYCVRMFITSFHISRSISYKGNNFLVPLLQQSLRSAGIPVVTEAPGNMQYTANGVHWCMVSHDAAVALFERLVQEARTTAEFTQTAPANLWAWHFNPISKRHFPTCIPCKKVAFESHFKSHTHQLNIRRLCFRMNALGQEQYCNSGVQFHEIIKDNPPGPLVTQEWLPADQTLPDELLTPGHHRRRSKPAIQHIEIFSCSGSLKKLHKSHDKPMMFSARITHSNSEQTTHTFKYFTAGRHRVAYTTPGYDWIVKWQCLNGSKNQNLEEWNKSKQMGTMNSFIPETDFYTQMRIGHMEISLLILQKVSLTFAEMIKLFSTTQPTQATMATVTGAATIVVIQLAQVSHAGLKPDDWHIRNIAFDDDDEKPQLKGFKLIDWADNHTANAPLLLRERMHQAFRQFSDCFQDFTSWGQHPRGLMHAHIWDTFMKSLHHTLTDWWSEWSMSVAGQDVDALPDDEHISQLHDRFQKIVFGLSSMHHLPRAINSGKAADQQNASILFAVRDHRSSGTFVLDTERPSLLRFSQMTRSPSNSTDQESMDSHLRARKTQGLYPFSTYTNIGQKGEVLMAEFEETTACTAKIEAQAPELLNFIRKDRDVQVGEAAVRGLLDAAMAMHHGFAVNLFRHGRSTAEDPGTSVPLQERWYNYIHGHRHAFPVFRPPENSMEGDDIRTIFQLFLEQVQDRGHLSRMQNAPRISYNVDKLHAAWWIKFTADITWCTMTTTAKRTHVRDWLFKKFTTDPKRKCMSPLPPAKRIKSDAKWPDFDIDDTELDVIVTSIFDQYVALPGIQS